MAQGTSNVATNIRAGSRLLKYRASHGDGSDRELACVLPSQPEAKTSRLWDFADLSPALESERTGLVGAKRCSDYSEAATSPLVTSAVTTPTGVAETEPVRSSWGSDGLTDSELDNLNAVLEHEMARNTMTNYRVQWRNLILS